MHVCEIKNPRTLAFRLKAGDNLNEELEKYLQETGAGIIFLDHLQAQVHAVTLGFWDVGRQVYEKSVIQPAGHSQIEPGAISGNVVWVNDKPFAHIHGSFFSANPAEKGLSLGGGHIGELIVGRTLEGRLTLGEERIVRVLDETEGCHVKTWRFPIAP